MNVGLITYHAGYNYGSVVQAYATYRTLQMMGNNVTVINYRPVSQKDNYAVLRKKMGIKTFINDLVLLPFYKERKHRAEKFEKFIQERYNLTEEFSSPYYIQKLSNRFDVTISGSDQLFNIRSEDLVNHEWDNMFPYLLKGLDSKKVSYASSVNDMADKELDVIKEDLLEFDCLSSREERSAIRLSNYLNKEVYSVVDPSLLQNKSFWINEFNLFQTDTEPYILYFSVNSGLRNGFKKTFEDISKIKQITQSQNCKIYIVTPFSHLFFGGSNIVNKYDYSPEEFVQLLYNAKTVFTRSYHGIALSIIFNKNFFFFTEKDSPDIRKNDLLLRLGLEDRVIYETDSILNKKANIDYSEVNNRLERLRKESFDYLKKSIRIS